MSSDYLTFSDLPKSILRPLGVDEFAAIIGVSRRTMIRLVKNGTLPKSPFHRSRSTSTPDAWPMMKPAACPMAYFDVTTGPLLSSQMRRRMIQQIGRILQGRAPNEIFEIEALRIDLPLSISQAVSRMAALAAAEAEVISDPGIRGGLPVIRGTRIGVYEIADLSKGEPDEYILEQFPSLTRTRLEHARLYAKAHPLPRRVGGSDRPRPPGIRTHVITTKLLS
ncbi:DUF433 domain-containing protein [Phaeobacter sp. B1627]|uniref:DUF433 domain-containing protein n=1 Tax=Phaeobacter sp. B1627 TaxID=2583809 RepID=UPI00159EBDA9|nr:DUF433 domain-containing protein [Phaeobacter sp. B1627]